MNEKRICQNCKGEFGIFPEDFLFYEKVKVPPPTFCPLCRAERRFVFRNERFLYRRKSELTGQEIFSRFAPEAPVHAYENDYWASDKWNPMDYGRDVDFSKPFLTQLKELFQEVPQRNMATIGGINSEYSNNFTDLKNCYLVFNI